MKKVLILSVIAMLALGVFALAGTITTTGNGPISTGATCSTASLQVVSNIYVLPGYVATATAYDATFCGATGNLLSGEIVTTAGAALVLGNSTTYTQTSGAVGVALASLQIKSNYQNIQVTGTVSAAQPSSGPQLSATFLEVVNGTYNSSTGLWNLPTASGSPYSGRGYLVGQGDSITPWVQAGKYAVTITFTITPATLDGNGNFSF